MIISFFFGGISEERCQVMLEAYELEQRQLKKYQRHTDGGIVGAD
jgi:hypothetical protein